MYQQALDEQPVQQVLAQIENKPNYTELAELPQVYKNAVISTEDHRFYTHKGIDVIAIVRALWHDIQAGSMVEGGSTITQQLAKNQFFTQKKELTRKVAEVFMAREIERLYEKDKILELYINSIYYGEGYYSVYDASMGYFGKKPSELPVRFMTEPEDFDLLFDLDSAKNCGIEIPKKYLDTASMIFENGKLIQK